MVSSSKILTVSYGTFSCTLEGFDESFDTMKAIAEYFRDLAQDDRYFGAEPPTPDAEMLARIAEREIARRVEARMENGSYVLRPSLGRPTSEPAAPPSEAPQAQPDPQTATPAQGGTMAEALAAQQAMANEAAAEAEAAAESDAKAQAKAAAEAEAEAEAEDETPTPEVPVETPEQIDTTSDVAAAEQVAAAPVATDDNSVAAKLQRIRAVVSASGAPTGAYAGPAYSEDEDVDAFLSDASEDDAFDSDSLEAAFADTIATVEPAPEAEADADADDDADTLGENLFTDTIAGFVADQASYDDDDDADIDGSEIATADHAPQPAAAAARDLAEEDADPAEEDARDVAAALSDAAVPERDDDSEARDTGQTPDAAARPRARLLRVKRADFDAAVAAGHLEEHPDAATPESSLSPEEEADLARELAEVEAELDRAWDEAEDEAPAEFPSADERPGLDDLDDLTDERDMAEADDRPEPRRDTGLRLRKAPPVTQADADAGDDGADDDDDEDFTLAAARASRDDGDADETDTAEEDTTRRAIEGVRKTLRLSSPAHAMLTQNKIEEDDTSVSRILNETNTQLEEPEGNRRRSAIAHLRAAVAATRADRILGRKKDPEKETEPYRADLASAVRPRRPMPSGEARSERPAMPRPAPLQLVAEQRIDAPEKSAPQTSAPVRPRRVTRSPEAETAPAEIEDDNGFVAFAEDMGATGLPDLLEAAAAYMSFVEGRDQFSRPQLMTKVRLAESGESSREDRLRSFGQLLRDGKIEKTHGGRFTASERISFKPGARAAG